MTSAADGTTHKITHLPLSEDRNHLWEMNGRKEISYGNHYFGRTLAPSTGIHIFLHNRALLNCDGVFFGGIVKRALVHTNIFVSFGVAFCQID